MRQLLQKAIAHSGNVFVLGAFAKTKINQVICGIFLVFVCNERKQPELRGTRLTRHVLRIRLDNLAGNVWNPYKGGLYLL